MYPDDSNDKPGLLGGGLGGGLVGKTARDIAAGGLNSVLGSADPFGNRPVENLYFLDKKIILDGYSFTGCRFDRCTLVITTSNFELINCFVDASCTIEYGHQVTKIIQLFNSRYPQAYQFFAPPFVPVINPNGTITIKAGL